MKILFISLIFSISICGRNQHPNLLINNKDIQEIRASLGKYPVFDKTYQKVKDMVDKALTIPIDVPVPKDAGGYTHERHKKNSTAMQAQGDRKSTRLNSSHLSIS